MNLSRPMRLLQKKWITNSGWPQRLEWLSIKGIRGWTGQRIDFKFPIIALSGENGSGKSTILQSAAAVYASETDSSFASDFFPDTAWETIQDAAIAYSIRQGPETNVVNGSVRKPTTRWLGNPDRPKRSVHFTDLARIQPLLRRTGYQRLAQPMVKETAFTIFEKTAVDRLSEIMGRTYSTCKMAVTDWDANRAIPVISLNDKNVSGYHQGTGEFSITEFLETDYAKYSLLLIDEIETSLHPRAQRRLMRDLANLCRERELQVILTTHSPFILSELPPEARGYILNSGGQREVVFGISPEFAMTKMDEENHPECDLYVEDSRAQQMLQEILVSHAPDIVSRVQIIPFGAASVGQALGQMVKDKKFPTPSLVFLDGDQPASEGCLLLPGEDAPERVVFEGLKTKRWVLLDMRTGRDFSKITDALPRAMTSGEHHDWISSAAAELLLGTDALWQAMCSTWAGNCLSAEDAAKIIVPIREILA